MDSRQLTNCESRTNSGENEKQLGEENACLLFNEEISCC